MRKIEKRIIDAIDNQQAVRLSIRDRVAVDDETRDTYVYLWDTCIASIGENSVSIDSCGWRTATTKSRLNAILRHYCGANIFQSNNRWYVTSHGMGYDYPIFTYATGKATEILQAFSDGMAIPRRN